MKKMKGFTVIETLIAIAITGITLGFGITGMQNFLVKQRVSAYAGDLLQSVHMARQYAILKGQTVTICASQNGKDCISHWSTGHLIFIDHNGDRIRDATDQVLNHVRGINTSDAVVWKSFKASETLQFLPTGITNHQNGTFTVCGLKADKHARGVIITKMGRPRMSQDENGDGLDEGANGKPLSCGAGA